MVPAEGEATATPHRATFADLVRSTPRPLLVASVALLGLLLAVEYGARYYGFEGPTAHLLGDLVGPPKRGRVIWASLALTLISLTPRQRVRALCAALALDVAFVLARIPFHTRFTYGNGPFIVLLVIGFLAWRRWDGGRQRNDTLRAVGLALLLIMGTKISDAWLEITVHARPMVLDQYVQTADHALGNLSWWMGRTFDASGPVVQRIIKTVYIELPVGAMLVAIWQLRKGWPSHHIVRTFLLVALIGPVFYILFPVVGPIFAYGPLGGRWAIAGAPWPAHVPWNLSPAAFRFDDITPRNCMPSLHTAWTVVIFVHTRRQPWALRAFGTFWTVCTIIATLGLGRHYGVDLVAGVVIALTIESMVRDPERGWDSRRWGLVLGGFALHAAMLLSFRYLAVPMARNQLLSAVLLLGSMAAYSTAFWLTFFATRTNRRTAGGDRGPVDTARTLASA